MILNTYKKLRIDFINQNLALTNRKSTKQKISKTEDLFILVQVLVTRQQILPKDLRIKTKSKLYKGG